MQPGITGDRGYESQVLFIHNAKLSLFNRFLLKTMLVSGTNNFCYCYGGRDTPTISDLEVGSGIVRLNNVSHSCKQYIAYRV